jgi:sugar phosphate isomerase/epimerase
MTGRRLPLGLISLDFEDLATLYETASARGIGWVEIFVGVTASESDVPFLLARRDGAGVHVASVSSMAKLALAEGDEVGDHTRLVERSIAMAREVGAPFATFMYGSAAGIDRPAARERFLARVAPLVEQAEDAGVTLLLENVFSRGTAGDLDSVEEILALFERLDSRRLGLNYDPANLAIGGEGAGAVAYRALRHLIRAVHLKDVRPLGAGEELDGRRVLEDHVRGPFATVPLGEGIVPVSEIVEAVAADERDLVVALEPTASGAAREAWLDAALLELDRLGVRAAPTAIGGPR